jgi:SAM-dependent methyltransferase
LAARRVERGRLAYYLAAADAGYWDGHWRQWLAPEAYRLARSGGLGRFESLFTAHLPKQGRILEAGCGLGQFVLALRVRGYDAEGVEWGADTVARVRQIVSDLPIRVGDVTRLDVPDGWYSAYISLGVVEHRREGPEPFLREAFRVLEPGGVALISVPSFHALRRFKARLGLYRANTDGLDFYQYAYANEEFSGLLEGAGFRVQQVVSYDGFKGVKDEIAAVRALAAVRGLGPRLRRAIERWPWAERRFGHMAMFVCRRRADVLREAA